MQGLIKMIFLSFPHLYFWMGKSIMRNRKINSKDLTYESDPAYLLAEEECL